MAGSMASPAVAGELAALSRDPRPEIRLAALAALAGAGDERAQQRIAEEVRAGLEASDVVVRNAALESVRAGDSFAVAPAIAMLGDAHTADAAAGAVGRLGDAILASMAELLESAGSPAPVLAMRLVRADSTQSVARDEVLRRHLAHPDRELALAVAERLVALDPAADATAVALDDRLREDVRRAARVLAALAAFDTDDAAGPSSTDAPLQRALRDELDLACLTVRANRLARHGSARLGSVLIELTDDGAPSGDARDGGNRGSRRALALEALTVVLGPAESRPVLALLHPELSVPERLARLSAELPTDGPSDLDAWLRNLVEDPGGQWGATWLRACAMHAARARGLLDSMDLATARAAGDPLIDEELDRA